MCLLLGQPIIGKRTSKGPSFNWNTSNINFVLVLTLHIQEKINTANYIQTQ